MKKTIMMMIVALAVTSASAVSLKWGGNVPASKITGLAGESLTVGAGSQTANLTVYYLVSTDLATVQALTGANSESSVAALAKASASGQTSTSTSATGLLAASSTVAGSSSGVNYFARVYGTFSGKDYYMDILGGVGTGGYWTTTKNGDSTVSETLAWAAHTYGGTGVAGDFSKWVAVPEPASAALALAGLAMLIRRRK